MPRRRVVRRRFLRLAVPIAGYWLAIAGVTHAFLRSTAGERNAGEPAQGDTETTAPAFGTMPDAPAVAAEKNPPDDVTNENVAVAAAPSVAVPASNPEPPSEAPPPEPATAPLAPPAEADFTSRSAPALPPAPPRSVARSEPRVARSEPRVARSEPSVAGGDRRVARNDTVARSESQLSDPLFALAPPLDDRTSSRSEVPTPPPPRESAKEEARAFSLPSCDAAAASANQTIDLEGARGAPDLTRDAFASVLENGAYLNRCEIPARTALDICAAVQNGKVVGISVSSTPRSPNVNACVRRAVVGLSFPQSARLDVTRTHFAAAR